MLMVLFEKIISNDKRDATCSPCGHPCSCIMYYAFMSKQKLLGTIKARPRSAVRVSNHAQYAVNRKYGVA